MKGRFIVLEGPDGSGTSTHSGLLADSLKAAGRDVLLTAEPTDSPIGLFIREQLKKKAISSGSALQLLFCADRAWHIENVIKPALEAGKTVVCDRYVISTLVYGEALGLDPEWLLRVNTPFIEPDVLLLALPTFEICMQRIGKREQLDVFENHPFQRKVYDLYTRVAEEDASIIVLDTSKPQEIVAREILAKLQSGI
ncbi:MAG: dTMP kinase [Candidatus Peribacteraceae bacterium]|nr:dTMP kinase [Candidatus Peribacteraceae bacterium]